MLASQVERTDGSLQEGAPVNGMETSEVVAAAAEQSAAEGEAPVEAPKSKRKGRAAGSKNKMQKVTNLLYSITTAQSQG